eukprot:5061325-Amphidinium_carterae.1
MRWIMAVVGLMAKLGISWVLTDWFGVALYRDLVSQRIPSGLSLSGRKDSKRQKLEENSALEQWLLDLSLIHI